MSLSYQSWSLIPMSLITLTLYWPAKLSSNRWETELITNLPPSQTPKPTDFLPCHGVFCCEFFFLTPRFLMTKSYSMFPVNKAGMWNCGYKSYVQVEILASKCYMLLIPALGKGQKLKGLWIPDKSSLCNKYQASQSSIVRPCLRIIETKRERERDLVFYPWNPSCSQ